jgi:hypothetical protein
VRLETLQGVQESWKPLKVPEKVNLKREDAFTHKVVATRSAEAIELLEEFRVFKAQEEWHFCTHKRDSRRRARREKNSKLMP